MEQEYETETISYEPLQITECFKKIVARYEKPKYTELTFTARAYIKLMFIIHLVGSYEVSGYGKIVNGKIVDLYLPQQVLTSTTAEIDEDAMVDFLSEIPTNELKYWELDWHSHVNMPTSPSSTDKSNYEEQAEARGNKQFVAMIVNKSESIWIKNVVSGVKFTDIEIKREPIDLSKKELKKIYEECVELVEDRCTKERRLTVKVTKNMQKDKSQLSLLTKETCSVCGKELESWEHDKCWECKRDEYHENTYYGWVNRYSR